MSVRIDFTIGTKEDQHQKKVVFSIIKDNKEIFRAVDLNEGKLLALIETPEKQKELAKINFYMPQKLPSSNGKRFSQTSGKIVPCIKVSEKFMYKIFKKIKLHAHDHEVALV